MTAVTTAIVGTADEHARQATDREADQEREEDDGRVQFEGAVSQE